MAKGSYDIAGMRAAASKINGYVENYNRDKNNMIELVKATTRFNDDPVVRNYLQKFEELKADMDGVQKLMSAYEEYLLKAAKAIEEGTSVK